MAPRMPASSGSSGLGRRLVWWSVVLAVLSAAVYVLDRNLDSFYVLRTDHLHDLARRSIAAHPNDTRAIVQYIVDELAADKAAASFMNPREEWFFNNAGGAMGGVRLLHASVTEYLIIFGTAVGTEGHTGRHTADDYFHILSGVQEAYKLGDYEPEVYAAGTMHHLRRGDVKQYRMPDGCFALEYARGWIPPMLFFGYADALSSTLDFPTLLDTTWITGREIVRNLLQGKL